MGLVTPKIRGFKEKKKKKKKQKTKKKKKKKHRPVAKKTMGVRTKYN